VNLSDCNISVRAYSCLHRAGIYTVEDLCNQTEDDMMRIRNLGRRCLMEILELMKSNGWKFKNN
jgi:DNA-directed RNA polymerase subunit alpha